MKAVRSMWFLTAAFTVCAAGTSARPPGQLTHKDLIARAQKAKFSKSRQVSVGKHRLTPTVARKHNGKLGTQHLIGDLHTTGSRTKQLGEGRHHLMLHHDGKQWNVQAAREGGKQVKTAHDVKVSEVFTGQRGKKVPASSIQRGSLICVIVFVLGTVEGIDPDPDDEDNNTATPLYVVICFKFK
jgi:hypothetical protein